MIESLPALDGYPAPYAARVCDLLYYEICLNEAESTARRVVYFHGRGGRAEGIGYPVDVGIPTWVLVPQASLRLPGSGGFAWSGYSVTSKKPLELAATLLQAAHDVARFLDDVRRDPSERFILSGFSQGAMLALVLALYHPDLCHAVVAAAADIPRALEPQRVLDGRLNPPLRIVQGSNDPIVSAAPMLEASARLRRLGYDIETAVFEHNEHSMNDEMMASFAGFIKDAFAR